MLSIGSLFTGIGGLELGLERAGLGPTSVQVEIDPGCREVLAREWPNADRSIIDVSKVQALNVDLICGGFPCQDISSAGKGAGLHGKKSGLWFEFFRIVQASRPKWVVVENVASGRKRWLSHVRHALLDAGYRSSAVALSASDVGAPHRRKRIFVVAYSNSEQLRNQQQRKPSRQSHRVRHEGKAFPDYDGSRRNAPNSDGQGELQPSRGVGTKRRRACDKSGRPAESAVRGMDDGIPHRSYWVSTEPPPPVSIVEQNRENRLKQLGNAVVPQCAEVIGRMIVAVETGEAWESVFG